LFLLAAVAKLSALPSFVSGIAKYELLPPGLVRPIGLTIPLLELTGGLLLAVGLGTPIVAALLALVLGAFTAAVAIALVKRKRIDCGCFGPGAPRPITWLTVGRNLGLLGLALFVAAVGPKALAFDALVRGGSHAAAATGLAGLLTGSLAVFAALLVSEALRFRALREAVGEEPA
jgi:uncharacterized membrane protein YphA (DoxX/SURF4 family)